MIKPDTKLVYVLQVSLLWRMETVLKMDVILTHTVKIVIMPRESRYVFNVSLQLIEFWLFLNMLVFASKDIMNLTVFVNNVPLDVLNVLVPTLVIDVLCQQQMQIMEHATVQQVISLLLSQLDSAKDVMIIACNVLLAIIVIYAYLDSQLPLMDNVSVQEETILILNFNVYHASVIAQYVQVKKFVLSVVPVFIFKQEFASKDVMLDFIFLVLYVKNANKDVNSVKRLDLVQFANQVDTLLMDYVILTVLKDLLPITPTIPA